MSMVCVLFFVSTLFHMVSFRFRISHIPYAIRYFNRLSTLVCCKCACIVQMLVSNSIWYSHSHQIPLLTSSELCSYLFSFSDVSVISLHFPLSFTRLFSQYLWASPFALRLACFWEWIVNVGIFFAPCCFRSYCNDYDTAPNIQLTTILYECTLHNSTCC